MSAATELFTTRGYAATSVREIVEAAGVTKPALYYHFKSKEGIYLAILDKILKVVDETFDTRSLSAGPVRQRIETLFLRIYEVFEGHMATVRFLNSVFWGPAQGAPAFDFETFHIRLTEIVRGIVAEGIATGEIRGSDPQPTVMALMAVLSFAMDLTLAHPELGVGKPEFLQVLDAVFKGVSAPAAPNQESAR